MEMIKRISVNLQIREIAEKCIARLKDRNYELIEQLFMAKVKSLFGKELKDFQQAEPNFKDLIKWFWKFYNIKLFTKKLTNKRG